MESWLLYFSLLRVSCTVCYCLFDFPLGGISRLIICGCGYSWSSAILCLILWYSVVAMSCPLPLKEYVP